MFILSVKLSMTHSPKPQTDFFLHIIATMFSDKSIGEAVIQIYGEQKWTQSRQTSKCWLPNGISQPRMVLNCGKNLETPTSLQSLSISIFVLLRKVLNMMKTSTCDWSHEVYYIKAKKHRFPDLPRHLILCVIGNCCNIYETSFEVPS